VKKYFLLIIIFFDSTFLFCQGNLDSNCIPNPSELYSSDLVNSDYQYSISTNPFSPINCISNGRKNFYFNWFSIPKEKKSIICDGDSNITNPAYQANNPKVQSLYNLIETMSPEDGWELLDRNFGYLDNDSLSNEASNQSADLYFCIYNKRLGIIRFFYALDNLNCYPPNLPKGLDINLSLLPGNQPPGVDTYSPSILDLAGILKPLEQPFESGYSFNRFEGLLTSTYDWLYADFPVVYDPCVCLYSSQLFFTVKLLKEVNMVTNGSINDTIITPFANLQGFSNINENNNNYSFGNFYNPTRNIFFSYKGNEGFASNTKNQINNIYYNDAGFAGESISALESSVSALAQKNFLKTSLLRMAYLKKGLGISDFFVGGGKKNKLNTLLNPILFGSNQSLRLSGYVDIVQYNIRNIIMAMPGSNLSSQINSTVKNQTFYNAPLGVFNLLTTPQFIVQRSEKDSSRLVDCKDCYDGKNEIIITTTTDKYVLQKPIKYVLNPYTDLEIADAQMALVFNIDSTNYYEAKRYSKLKPEGKIAVTNQYKFRSDYFNMDCFNKASCSISKTIISSQVNSPAVLGLLPQRPTHVKIMLSLKDRVDSNCQNVIYIVTYPISVISEDDRTINTPLNCDSNFFIKASKSELAAFCQSTNYKTNRDLFLKPSKVLSPDSSIKNILLVGKSKILITPNPATGSTLLTIESFEKESTDIYITDVYGKIVGYVVKGQILEVGKSEIDINLSGLQKGMYIIHVQSNVLHQKAKLIVE
jgi:hypothetical protein